MTTADWALIISLLSAATAMASLAWNIWSKFIFPKPVLKVQVSVVTLIDDGEPDGRFVRVDATNHGPIPAQITRVVCRIRARFPHRDGFGILQPIEGLGRRERLRFGIAAGGIPRQLPVGEGHSLYFVFDGACFLSRDVSRVGVSDGFGRLHWAPRREVSLATEAHQKDFPALREGHQPVQWFRWRRTSGTAEGN